MAGPGGTTLDPEAYPLSLLTQQTLRLLKRRAAGPGAGHRRW